MESLNFVQPSSFIFFLLIISIGYILIEIIWGDHYFLKGSIDKYKDNNLFDRIIHYVLIGLIFQSLFIILLTFSGGEKVINDLIKAGYDFSHGLNFDKSTEVDRLSIQLVFSSIVYFLYIVISIALIYIGMKILEVVYILLRFLVFWFSKKIGISLVIDYFISKVGANIGIHKKILIFGIKIFYIERCVKEFIKNDYDLIKFNAHEQSITHRIAYYIEKSKAYKKYDIDCEYNKSFRDPKSFKTNGVHRDLGWIEVYSKDILIDSQGKIIHSNGEYAIAYILEGSDTVIGKIQESANGICLLKDSKQFRPDIVIHKRGIHTFNNIVFEIKKEELSGMDKIKLEGLTKNGLSFEYKFGIGISEITKEKVKISIYRNGKMVVVYKLDIL